MSLHYLLDGNNIIHQMPLSVQAKFDEDRKQLVTFIERSRPQGSLKNKVTLVFDGNSGKSGLIESSMVRIVFSQHRSADDYIRETVEKSSNAKNMIIVTDDRAIQYAVGACGAKVCCVKDFLTRAASSVEQKNQKPRPSQTEKVKHISKSQEFDINSEFEKIWLKPKEE